MKKILWLGCGGTISCKKTEQGLVPAADNESMGQLAEKLNLSQCEITPRCIMNIDSTQLLPHDAAAIANQADRGIRQGFDGIVITHGTDTMAYCAAMLFNALDDPPIPIIMTGAQRPLVQQDSDGTANLTDAFAAACDDRFAGVYLVFGGLVLQGDKAIKMFTEFDSAFLAPSGYSALVNSGVFSNVNTKRSDDEYHKNKEYHYNREYQENISLIKLTPFTSADEINFLVDKGIKGLVLEGFGSGGVAERLLDAVKNAVSKGVKVIFVSQCLFDGADMDKYQVGIRAKEAGVISGGQITAEAALAMLMYNKI